MEESRLLSWTVENFMSIEKATVEFDDQNIINFKGYNDSGKSAMLTALKVLMTNSNPAKQASFIQDDKTYFRVIAKFSGGITILRDKYINGQSLYEMYKDNEVIFSTKVNGALTKVAEVPQPIADFLGLITFDGVCLNARSCFEKQIGVQNTGSENYRMFNVVLRSEELAAAGHMLNVDSNKLAADINLVENDLRTMRSLCDDHISAELVDGLKKLDSSIDFVEAQSHSLHEAIDSKVRVESIEIPPELSHIDSDRLSRVDEMVATQESLRGIRILPELHQVDSDRLSQLFLITDTSASMHSVKVAPHLESVDEFKLGLLQDLLDASQTISSLRVAPALSILDTDRIESLEGLVVRQSALDSMPVAPELSIVDMDRLALLQSTLDLLASYQSTEQELINLDTELDSLNDELIQLQEDSQGAYVRCPNCGMVFEAGEAHADI